MAIVPTTKARLQPYIRIFNTTGPRTQLGAIQEISLKIDRDTDLWRELSTDRGGQPVEIYPKLPLYMATLRRVVLYDIGTATLMAAFNLGGSWSATGF